MQDNYCKLGIKLMCSMTKPKVVSEETSMYIKGSCEAAHGF